MGFDLLLQFILVGAEHFVNFSSVFKESKRWHGRDTALRGGLLVVIDVTRGEYGVRKLRSKLLVVRFNLLAGTAPFFKYALN